MLTFQGLSLKDVPIEDREIVEEIEEPAVSDVAVIGVAIDFPQAKTLEAFWDHLRTGRDLIGGMPTGRRRDIENYLLHKGNDPAEVEFSPAAYLDEIDRFDHRFFKLSPLEASLMDPVQRLFTQCAWRALEDAGYVGKRSAGSVTGVYLGLNPNAIENYFQYIRDVQPDALKTALPGNLTSMAASRISYALDLSGPSLIVNTACSSSLVALHLACQALKTGDCDMALAGGVNIRLLSLEHEDKIGKSQDGRARTFDDQATGTADGEGAAAVLLKPLRQALADGDHVYAVIKGSAVNQDGTTNGITVPNARAQANVLERAWQSAGIHPESIRYIEAHGTGTELGDPIEIEGVTMAFRRYTDQSQFCGIGSIKPNLGHLDAASGIAGFIKAVLALNRRELPPSIHFQRPNRKIPFTHSPVYVQDELEPWETDGTPRRCGVSSFGLSGTNCHVVLEEAPQLELTYREVPRLFTASANSRTALAALLRSYERDLTIKTKASLGAVCYTVQTGRGHFPFRVAIVTDSVSDLRSKIARLLENGLVPSQKGVFCQVHRVVPDHKREHEAGDVTQKDLLVLREQANQLVQRDADWSALTSLGNLYACGAEIDWEALYTIEDKRRIPLPQYAFDRTRCWLEIYPVAGSRMFSTIQWVEAAPHAYSERHWGKTLIVTGSGSNPLAHELLNVCTEAGLAYETAVALEQAADFPDGTFARVLDMSALASEPGEFDPVESLFRYVRLFASQKWGDKLELVLAAPTVHEVDGKETDLHPIYSAVFALGKTIAVEHPQLLVRALDLDKSICVNDLLRELNDTEPPYLAAYRNSRRYVQQIVEATSEIIGHQEVKIRPFGTYLITGGTGGMGLEIAKHLATKQPVRLALVSRDPGRTESQRAAIREIQAAGSNVLLYAADCGDETAMLRVIEDLRSRWGGLNGIVHAAGVPSAGMLYAKEEETFKRVLRPKIQGTQVLEKLTEEEPLDFFVLFSAMTSLTGGFGQGEYAAANAYLDAFAPARTKRGARTLTINWAVWRETGMGVEHGVVDQEHMFHPLWTQEALDAFDIALNSRLTQVLIGAFNFRELRKIKPLMDQPRFPIILSPPLLAQVEQLVETAINASETREKISAVDEEPVVLTGRDSGEYNEHEWQLANIWKQTLGVREVGLYDSFYELGGDSIFAAKMVNAIQVSFGLSLSMVEFLGHLTIADLARFLKEKAASGWGTAHHRIEPILQADAYPLSSAQHRLFILNQMQPEQTAYNVTVALRIKGTLNRERFTEAFQTIMDRHETLRTRFLVVDGVPMQQVLTGIEVPINHLQVSETEVNQVLEESVRSFDLKTAPLWRVTLLQVSNETHVMLLDMHHIIADGFSIGILTEEFFALYGGHELPALSIQYKDFANWQNEQLSGEALASHQTFWQEQFSPEPPLLLLPADYPRPAVQSLDGDTHLFFVGGDVLASLKEWSTQTNTSMFMLLLAAFNVLLAKYANQEDIVIGSPSAGRTHVQTEPLIGMFANTLVYRNRPMGELPFAEFLQEVKENALRVYEHQEYPFEKLVADLALGKDLSRNPLFDAMFVMHNENKVALSELPLYIESQPMGHRVAKVDLTLEATLEMERLVLVIEYATALFHPKTIERMSEDFGHLLKQIAEDPLRPIRQLEMASGAVSLQNVLTEEIDFSF
ncbi:phosphopantetheine binding protein [Brevibacillus sp. AG162]|uniref:SDR family NAD(P)-dependent oxidoreductase n=1 Tax=Brevibacillus sp. AG162 TaxID=2572910 RepID=UPI0011500CC0|nr:SDR family NAD(P)-dependent oxidoreductase [Brevibacillus sp. AG162]TQK75365.1 phosphopantetheine binding protein [Brevibacillus sp. AG162]